MIPEGTQRWQLRSVQIPDAEEGSPYLFTYVDGERVILLIQVHGEKLSLQPVGTAVATLSGTRNVRGGIEAFCTETTLEKGKAIELAWNEDDLVVSLRSEQVDLDTLAGIADVLIYSNPSLTSTTEPVHNQVNQ